VNSLLYVEESLDIFFNSKVGNYIKTLCSKEITEGLQELSQAAEEQRKQNIQVGTLEPAEM